MDPNGRRDHWQQAHERGRPDEASWWQENPSLSLKLIDAADLDPAARVIDVGGGASTLVDHLLAHGFHPTVLDVAEPGLEHARSRLGARSSLVDWVAADVLTFRADQTFDCWHDRAVFHFLTDHEDRAQYLQSMNAALRPGGSVIIATFGLDGPEYCSGLPVVRYDAESLAAVLGPEYRMIATETEVHRTPKGVDQAFVGLLLRRTSPGDEPR